LRRYPATFFILITSLALQVFCTFFPSVTDVLALTPGSFFVPLQLISHQLSHASWPHLIGNFTFGLPFLLFLEHKLGRAKVLEYYILCGLGSAALQCLLGSPSSTLIGSSGALFGVMVGACLAFGTTKVEHYLAMALIAARVIPQLAAAPESMHTDIAVYMHIGGALTGIALSHTLYNHREVQDAPKPS